MLLPIPLVRCQHRQPTTACGEGGDAESPSDVPKRDNAKRREQRRREQVRALRAKAREQHVVYAERIVHVKRPFWAALITSAWLIVGGIMVGGTVIPHVEDEPTFEDEPVTAPAAPPRPPKVPGRVAAPSADNPIRRLAWAPYPGASSYVIRLYQGDSLLYETRSRGATIEIPLAAGEYRWVVYPVVRGYMKSRAVVNSSLSFLDN